MNNTKAVVGMIAGLAAGAALGLLFAPESGEITRDRLSESLSDLGENVKDFSGRAYDSIKNSVSGTEDTYEDEVDFV